MGIFSTWFKKKEPLKRTIGIDGNGLPINLGSSNDIFSSSFVSEQSTLALSTVWRAARVIAESVGTMPMKVYKHSDTGRTEARDHPLWSVVHDEPNPEQSAVDFFSLLQFWAIVWGNAYAEIERTNAGEVIAFNPVPPWAVKPTRNSAGQPVYEVSTESGIVTLDAVDMVHIKGPTIDGTEGCRLVQIARTSFELSLSCERFGASYFGNSCKLGGVLKTAGILSDIARENLKKSWTSQHAGPDKVGSIGLLEEGLDFLPFSINNNEGQFIESRQHQVLEVCRWIGVDPIFVYAFGANPGAWPNSKPETS
jgi:HK97 family phage portal protein